MKESCALYVIDEKTYLEDVDGRTFPMFDGSGSCHRGLLRCHIARLGVSDLGAGNTAAARKRRRQPAAARTRRLLDRLALVKYPNAASDWTFTVFLRCRIAVSSFASLIFRIPTRQIGSLRCRSPRWPLVGRGSSSRRDLLNALGDACSLHTSPAPSLFCYDDAHLDDTEDPNGVQRCGDKRDLPRRARRIKVAFSGRVTVFKFYHPPLSVY
ncbi:hypothetical protein L226DRAFT_401285 [Lentinus tigrinus ALCF2SS1-7]|uniref:Uncharacterized protein n=1 Tax=Lentinus tigrinus ALCF2SS1-6 TaxID=1328759 RepID=A0A5C2RPM3_9APHY|nr:hypothetical protein L227DRAFT_62537 [Lentinus tigrinus ALCF2SS1-6]RPD52869.1 hypothetical protein L227DRAFT_428023 [Lentinus tigrinus ALCF2SS1-6]RPD67781.1 hypothetical protein L226DRAFT_401285 [Lentinus tigrinus ALCF2SS1-7]